MRDVISNETIKEINEVIDEILTNIDDNVRNIQNGEGNSALPTLFSFTNYSGQIHKVHGSIFRNHIIIDNADGNSYSAGFRTEDGDIFTTIGDKNGKQIATVDEKVEGYSNLAYFRESYKSVGTDQYGTEYDEIPAIPFDITHNYYTDITGFSFDILEQSNSASITDRNCRVMSFKLANIPVGSTFTVTFRGRFSGTFLEDKTPYIAINDRFDDTDKPVPLGGAYVDIIKDEQVHNYSITFTNSTQFTDLYLHFYFDVDSFTSFDVDSLLVSEMDIGIIRCEVYHSGKWYMIATGGGGTSDLDAIELTYAEYQALTPAEKTDPDKIYFITDYPSGSGVVINPTGTATDTAETIEVDGTIYDFMDADAVHTADIGVAGGVAELDSNGKVPSSQLPSFVDDVVEGYYDSNTDRFYEESTFTTVIPPIGGKSWVDVLTNKSYRWTGSVYVRVDEGVQLGETSSTAYRGDRGKIAYDHSQSDHSGIAPAFTEASTRANIASGETFATLLGKIKKFFSDLKAVAFTGAYSDLSGTPTIPTVNNATLTIQKNGTTVETFTANASSNKTANITVPTKVSELTNDSGYTTNTGTVTSVKVGSTSYSPSSGVVSLPAYPTSLPASDVYSWAKASSKPSYTASEVSAVPRIIAKIPATTSPSAGWRRICKINYGDYGYENGFVTISGGWNNGAPSSAIISICCRHTAASMTLIHNFVTDGMIQQVRLVNISGSSYWFDAYMKAQSGGVSEQYFIFFGNFAISDIQNSATIITGGTASASVNLTATAVTGTLITSGSIGSQSVNYATSAGSATSATSATKATQDGDGNTISSTYLKKSGGTMTGTLTSRSIEPVSDILYSLGLSSKRFNVGWFRILNSDTVTCGRTGVGGKSTQGILEFYPYNHANDNRVQFMVDSDATLTTIYTVNIRAKSGTLALTSDIPSVPSQAETTRRSRYTMSTKGAWTTASYSSNLPSSYAHAIILIYYTISGIRCLMNEIRVTKAEWEDCASPNIMMPFVSSPPNDAYGVYLQYVSTSQFKYYVGSGLQGDWSVTIKTTVV